MHVLIILDHPQPGSFSAAIAEEVRRGAEAAGHTVQTADLAAERFDGSMTSTDLAHFRGNDLLPDDVRREQLRVDSADALVLVFPIYWWSLPARLKGWVDRVFTHGWAYVDGSDGTIEGRLRNRPVHLLALGATDADAFERHGYAQAMDAQIPYGIFSYCGLRDVVLHRLLDSDALDPGARAGHLKTAFDIGAALEARSPMPLSGRQAG